MAKQLIIVNLGQSDIILGKLLNLAIQKIPKEIHDHVIGGKLYTRIMLTFLCRHFEVIDTILYANNNLKPFPFTVIASLVRCLFELHLNAKYISLKPIEYSKQYVEFYDVFFAERENKYLSVKTRNADSPAFVEALSNRVPFDNTDIDSFYQRWSKKSIRDMAFDAGELDEYDLDYPVLSAYTHGDVIGSLPYLDEKHKTVVIRNSQNHEFQDWLINRSAQYFTCFLQTFSKEFSLNLEKEIMQCWEN